MSNPLSESTAVATSLLLEQNIISIESKAPDLIEEHCKNKEETACVMTGVVNTLKCLQEFVEKEIVSPKGKMELMMNKAMIRGKNDL
jgi:hypothetical protein